jgi:hypothetical protein
MPQQVVNMTLSWFGEHDLDLVRPDNHSHDKRWVICRVQRKTRIWSSGTFHRDSSARETDGVGDVRSIGKLVMWETVPNWVDEVFGDDTQVWRTHDGTKYAAGAVCGL